MKRGQLATLGAILAVGVLAFALDAVEQSARYERIDHAVERMMPRPLAAAPTPVDADDVLVVRLQLRREGADGGAGDTTVEMSPTGTLPGSDETVDSLRSGLRRVLDRHGGRHVRAEIIVPPGPGASVPHRDVVRVLNLLLELEITDFVLLDPASARSSN